MKKKLIVSLLLIAFILRMVYVSQNELDIDSASYFAGYGASLTTASDTSLKLEFSVIATRKMTKLGVSSIELYDSRGNLQYEYKYEDSRSGVLLAYETGRHSGYQIFPAELGKTYHAVITFYAQDDNENRHSIYTTPKVRVE